MAVYQIVDLDVYNPELYAGYVARVADIVRAYGGRYIVRGGTVTPLGGDWNPRRLVIIEFESLERLQQCYASPEYQEIAPLREQSSRSKSIAVEGMS
jgi:uncharacterized protein (DUF1330 family)